MFIIMVSMLIIVLGARMPTLGACMVITFMMMVCIIITVVGMLTMCALNDYGHRDQHANTHGISGHHV